MVYEDAEALEVDIVALVMGEEARGARRERAAMVVMLRADTLRRVRRWVVRRFMYIT